MSKNHDRNGGYTTNIHIKCSHYEISKNTWFSELKKILDASVFLKQRILESIVAVKLDKFCKKS